MLKTLLPLCALLFLLFGGQAFAKGVPACNIEVGDAAAMIHNQPADLIILDVRTPAEYAQGHIPGAKNMDFFSGNFDKQANSLPRDKTIMIYCSTGRRSAGALEILNEAGFPKILHMHQGMEAWERAGMPQERE